MAKEKVNSQILKVPPHADEAEVSVLGAMMLDTEAVSKVFQYIDHTAFYKNAHQLIFKTMEHLFNENSPIDQISVIEGLKKKKNLEEVGGAYYITGLVESTPSAANVEYYTKIVMEKSILRKLISVSNEIQTEAYDGKNELHDIIDNAETKIFALSESRSKEGFKNFLSVLNTTFEHIDTMSNSEYHTTGIPSGFNRLDDMTSGFHDGDLVILAGRPSMGKTALALTIARNAAVEFNVPIGFFSLEMPDYQLALRLLCAEAGVDNHLVRTGKLPKEQWRKLTEKTSKLTDAPIFIDDTPALSLTEIRAKARRLKAESDIKLIVIDYLQLIKGNARIDSRQQQITEISQGLKALAKEIKVPVLALSQLSRAVESRTGDHRPQLSDLRESGAIEQDADVVMFVYRPIVYARKAGDEERMNDPAFQQEAEIIIGKQRNGPIGIVNVAFIDRFAQFKNLDTHHHHDEETPF